MPGSAVELKPPAHHFHHAAADRQAQAGAAKAAGGGGFGLREHVEDALLMFRRNTDAGVAHPAAQVHLVLAMFEQPDADHYLAHRRELDGVAGEVDQHLFKPRHVAA